MLNRLVANWVYGGFLAGVLLLLITPIVVRSWSLAVVSIFLCLPIYMVHQYEEHDNDRFRHEFNRTIGRGQEVLSPLVVFISNVPGVWGVIGIALWLAVTVDVGLGLIASYLLIVNAVVHVAGAVVFRGYNPGLLTAILLFLPLGGFGLYEIGETGGGTAWAHVIGLISAIAIHAAVLVHVRGNSQRLARSSTAS